MTNSNGLVHRVIKDVVEWRAQNTMENIKDVVEWRAQNTMENIAKQLYLTLTFLPDELIRDNDLEFDLFSFKPFSELSFIFFDCFLAERSCN